MAETIIKLKRREGFTVLPNALLRDSRLSLKTKGLLCVMLSLPEDWSYTVGGLSKVCGAGRDAVRSALRELEAAEYLIRAQLHDGAGKFGGNLYVISDVSNSPLPDDAPPLPGFPSTENPTLQTKDINNTPYSPPEGDATPSASTALLEPSPDNKPKRQRRIGRPKDGPTWKPERFAGFWRVYPRKVAKQSAIKAWDKLQPDDVTIALMGRALLRQIASEAWRRDDGQYIPHPATWLNQARWEDEISGIQEPPPEGGGGPLRGEGVVYL